MILLRANCSGDTVRNGVPAKRSCHENKSTLAEDWRACLRWRMILTPEMGHALGQFIPSKCWEIMNPCRFAETKHRTDMSHPREGDGTHRRTNANLITPPQGTPSCGEDVIDGGSVSRRTRRSFRPCRGGSGVIVGISITGCGKGGQGDPWVYATMTR